MLEEPPAFTPAPAASPCRIDVSVEGVAKIVLFEERNCSQTPSALWPITPSDERPCPPTPSSLLPATPCEERILRRTPPGLCPMNRFEERHCSKAPSMLRSATPVAWPATNQDTRTCSTKQDTPGYA